ncbi:methionine synthase [Pelomyxa schiedti]|nr:methionine synthase [Pelomyxa schiedti]
MSATTDTPAVTSDGAMGTQLQIRGLGRGECPEAWNADAAKSPLVSAIHDEYLRSGACVVETNTFGGNRMRLALHSLGSPERVDSLNRTGAALAKHSCSQRPFPLPGTPLAHPLAAGSVGPTGSLLEPLGPLAPADARAAFREQAAALGGGGADMLLVETMSSLEEVREAVLGCREGAPGLPVAATMSFERRGRTLMGVTPKALVGLAAELGLALVGANCGSGADETAKVMREMCAARDALGATPRGSSSTTPESGPGTGQQAIYLMAQANAGLPSVDAATGEMHYSGTPEQMAAFARDMRGIGVNYIGACCGSTPQHIAAICAALAC